MVSFWTVVLESLWSFSIGTLWQGFSHPYVQKNLFVFHISGTRLSRRGLGCLLSLLYAP